MLVYEDEDKEPMRDDYLLEYTGVINDRAFKETGECWVEPARDKE